MVKRLLATCVLLAFLAMPTLADTMVKTFQLHNGHTLVITIT
jgi:hypothetical protein